MISLPVTLSARKLLMQIFLILLGSLILGTLGGLFAREIIVNQQQDYLNGVSRRISPTLYTYDLYTMGYLLEEVLNHMDVHQVTIVDSITDQELISKLDSNIPGPFQRFHTLSSTVYHQTTPIGTATMIFIDRSMVIGLTIGIILTMAGGLVFVLHLAWEQRKKTRAVQQQLEDMQHSYRLTRLILRLAHQFGTPLGNIQLAVSSLDDLSKNKTLTRSQLHESVSLIQQNVQFIDKVLQKLRAINLIDSEQQPESVDLGALVRDSYTLVLDTIADRKVTVFIECPETAPICTYSQVLQTVLQELITNTLVHNPEKPVELRISAETSGGSFSVHVQDNGAGIPDELVPELFQLPIQGELNTKPRYGLFIASKLCQKYLHGTLEFENKKEWNCFTIRGTVLRDKACTSP